MRSDDGTPRVDSAAGGLRQAVVTGREGDPGDERGALAGRAGDLDVAAERLDAVPEPDEPGSPGGVRAAAPVVPDPHAYRGVGGHLDLRVRGVRVLGDVGKRLGDDVVHGHLSLLAE